MKARLPSTHSALNGPFPSNLASLENSRALMAEMNIKTNVSGKFPKYNAGRKMAIYIMATIVRISKMASPYLNQSAFVYSAETSVPLRKEIYGLI